MEPLNLMQHQILRKWKVILEWTDLDRYSKKKMRLFLSKILRHIKSLSATFYLSKSTRIRETIT